MVMKVNEGHVKQLPDMRDGKRMCVISLLEAFYRTPQTRTEPPVPPQKAP